MVLSSYMHTVHARVHYCIHVCRVITKFMYLMMDVNGMFRMFIAGRCVCIRNYGNDVNLPLTFYY